MNKNSNNIPNIYSCEATDSDVFGRRDFIRTASLCLVATMAGGTLAGCGNGSAPAKVTSRAGFVVNPDPGTIANDNGTSINFLAALTSSTAKQAAYWGTVDANQNPQKITQSLYWDADITKGTRTQYDAAGLPVLVIHEANAAFMTINWNTDHATFKFYQPSGDFVGGSTVTLQGGSFVVSKLVGSTIGGTFRGTLSGLQQGIVSFTLTGGNGRSIARAIAGRTPHNRTTTTKSGRTSTQFPGQLRGTHTSTRDVSPTIQYVKAFTGDIVGGNLPTFALTLLQTIVDQRNTTGSSGLSTSIATTALTGTSSSASFINGGEPLLLGLTVVPLLATTTASLIARIDQGEDLESKGEITVSTASPGTSFYATSVDFKTPSTVGDNSIVSGLAASREIGSVPLSGTIYAANQLYISGTASTGEQITLTGTVVDNKVRQGTWTISGSRAANRATGNGNWDADPTQPGQCTVQENSGAQGIFTQTYDLGIACGSFDFTYQAYTIPDQFQIFYEGKLLLDTGSVSGGTTLSIPFNGSTTQIIVVVTANLTGTLWNYTVGCPTSH